MNLINHRLRLVFLGLATIILVSESQCIEGNQAIHLDWDKVHIAFRQYLDYMSPKNARALLDLLPVEKASDFKGNQKEAMELIYSNMDVLESKIWSGDTVLSETALRLLDYSDGHFTEWLGSIIAELARINPSYFLHLMQKYKNSYYIQQSGYPLLFLTNVEASVESAFFELEARKRGLAKINDYGYVEIRDECIKLLDERLSMGIFLRPRLAEYEEIVDFFNLVDVIFSDQRLSIESDKRVSSMNIDKLMAHISKKGVDFIDIKNNEIREMANVKIKEEISSYKGPSFEIFNDLALFFKIRMLQTNKLQIDVRNDHITIAFGSVIRLRFEKENNQYLLRAFARVGSW